MIDLRHLRHALALAEHKHYAKAAAICHISQPALSRSIQTLETLLDAKLFDRGRDGVEATQLGKLLLRHAAGMDQAARELEREFILSRGMEISELTIGVGPFGGAALIGPVVAKLSQRYPRLHIEIVIAPWKELPERLRSHHVDIVLIEISDIVKSKDFAMEPLSVHRGLLVTRPQHPLARKPKPVIADIFNYSLVGPRLPGKTEKLLLNLAPKEIRTTLNERGMITIQCDSSIILKEIIKNSDAISLMNQFMVESELRRNELVTVNGVDLGVNMQYGAVWYTDRALSGETCAFLELLREEDQRWSDAS